MKLGALFHKCLPFFSFLLFVGILWILKQELNHYKTTNILNSISTIPKTNVYLAILLTFLGYLIIATYDQIALLYSKYPLKITRVLSVAYISYAICNTTSFALFIGGGIRYYLYSFYNVPKKIIAQIIAFSNLNFWIGLLAVGGLTFISVPLAVPQLIHIRFITTRPIGIIFLCLTIVYLYLSWQQQSLTIKGEKLTFPPLSISLMQIITSALDWAIASAVLYVLLPSHTNLSYWSFFGIYLLGISAAIISHIPGGLGVFETIVLYLLPQQVSASDALGSLLAYRGIYFLLPLFIALIWLGLYELRKKLKLFNSNN
jgi:glycosyltransferase 2 family protein